MQFFLPQYWMFKFRDPQRSPSDPNPPSPVAPRTNDYFASLDDAADNSGPARERTPLQASFASSYFITCQVSMLGFLVVTALFRKRLPPPSKRIKGALFAMLVLFLINTAFTKINTDSCKCWKGVLKYRFKWLIKYVAEKGIHYTGCSLINDAQQNHQRFYFFCGINS